MMHERREQSEPKNLLNNTFLKNPISIFNIDFHTLPENNILVLS